MHSEKQLMANAYGYYFTQSYYFSFGYFACPETVLDVCVSSRYRRLAD
jgi:hypothetical protein